MKNKEDSHLYAISGALKRIVIDIGNYDLPERFEANLKEELNNIANHLLDASEDRQVFQKILNILEKC